MKRITMLLIVTLILAASAYPAIWYVDKDGASGSEDGRSWETAFTTIQPAIDAASEDGGELWIAEGVYDEQRVSLMYDLPVDTGSLIMREHVEIYGGFTGSESQRHQRNWRDKDTIIDGSNARSGHPAFHVVVGADDATLDGLTITGGEAPAHPTEARWGGGMRNVEVSPEIVKCVFLENEGVCGGGIGNLLSQPTVRNCSFFRNSARLGGAICSGQGHPVVVGCTFADNTASGSGGAISNSYGAGAQLRDCVFRDNRATGDPAPGGQGGAISSAGWSNGSSIEVQGCVFEGNSALEGGAVSASRSYSSGMDRMHFTNCVFVGNSATGNGGAMSFVGEYEMEGMALSLTVSMTNCSFGGNEAGESGSGVWIDAVPGTIRNCIFWDEGEDEIVRDHFPSPAVTYSAVQGGYRGEGNIDVDPRYFDVAGGDLRLRFGSPCIDAGTAAGAPETDIQGWTRPVGDGIDMGAYESPDADVNDTGDVDATDVQVVTNAVLGLDVSPYTTDINFDRRTNAVDIQLVINAVLGL